ncbi:hypothetical protein [Virgibacillus salexigens]|uniref:hypothetical protein n=1 Tax=Virgibacillus massiliensis TaxID=1462526 RepID=UPI000A4744EE|nr:hypothetical protein [Virgibacillus massiliensis]
MICQFIICNDDYGGEWGCKIPLIDIANRIVAMRRRSPSVSVFADEEDEPLPVERDSN